MAATARVCFAHAENKPPPNAILSKIMPPPILVPSLSQLNYISTRKCHIMSAICKELASTLQAQQAPAGLELVAARVPGWATPPPSR